MEVVISTGGSLLSENVSNGNGPRKAGLRVAMDRVMREKSAVRELSLPRELANRLVTLSRADISQELKQSCADLVGRDGKDGDKARGAETAASSEKEFLLNRLHQLLNQERVQVRKDLEARRSQLREVKEFHRKE